MPALETADRWQKAVLWPFVGYDGYGQPVVGSPVELDVRWEHKRREVLDAQGNTVALDATVVLDREIPINSNIWLGELASWAGTGSSGDDTEVMEVVTYNETPDLKGRNIRRTAGVKRFRDSPATP